MRIVNPCRTNRRAWPTRQRPQRDRPRSPPATRQGPQQRPL